MNNTLLFDLDGVLVDTPNMHRAALAAAAAKFGYIVPDLDASTTISKLRAAAVPENDIQRVYTLKREIFEESIAALPMNPELGYLFGELRFKKIRYAVCSNSNSQSVYKVLSRLGISADAITSDLVAHGKPAPDIYIYAMGVKRVTPTECVVFEDTDEGECAARRAGIENVVRCTHLTIVEEVRKWL